MMLTNLKNFIKKFKKWIIALFIGTALASGLSGIPQDLYNNLNVKVYSVCDLQSSKRTSIADDLTAFKARNPDNSLRELNAGERAGFKSCEIAKKGTEFAGIYDSVQYGTRIEIIGEVKAIEMNGQHGIELFARAWKGGQQLGFGKDGSVEIERFRIFNPPILVPDINGTIIREWTDDKGVLQQRKLREDLLEATRQVIAHNAKIVGIENAPIVIGKVGNTTSTFYPVAGANSPVDGFSRNDPAAGTAWATIRGAADGTGASVADTDHYLGHLLWDNTALGWSDGGNGMWRSFTLFDTSSLGTDSITSSTLSFVVRAKRNAPNITDTSLANAVIVSATPANTNNIVAADFDQIGSTSFGSIAYATVNTDNATYNDVSLNASGIANINKTGVSKFGQTNKADNENTEPSGMNATGSIDIIGISADTAGTTSDPKLVVVHAAAVAAGEEYQIIFE